MNRHQFPFWYLYAGYSLRFAYLALGDCKSRTNSRKLRNSLIYGNFWVLFVGNHTTEQRVSAKRFAQNENLFHFGSAIFRKELMFLRDRRLVERGPPAYSHNRGQLKCQKLQNQAQARFIKHLRNSTLWHNAESSTSGKQSRKEKPLPKGRGWSPA